MPGKQPNKKFPAPLVEFCGNYQVTPKGRAGEVRVTSPNGQVFDVVAESPRTFLKLVGDLRQGGNIQAALEDEQTEIVLRYHSRADPDPRQDRSLLIQGYYEGRWRNGRSWNDHWPIRIRIPARRSGNRSYHQTVLHVHVALDLRPHLPAPGDAIIAQGIIVQHGTRTRFAGTGSRTVSRYWISIHTIQTDSGIFQTQLYRV